MSDRLDDILQHVGIPGMKWGKRKARPEASGPKSTRQLKHERDAVFIKELIKIQGGNKKISDQDAIEKAMNSKAYKDIDAKVKSSKGLFS